MSDRKTLVLLRDVASRLRYENNVDGCKVLSREHVGSTRWSQVYDVVFSFNDAYWRWTYEEASTEMQDSEDFLDDNFLEAEEVFPREKTVVVYE